MRNKLYWIGGAAALGLAVWALGRGWSGGQSGAFDPLTALGQALRALSLSGIWGNLGAWMAVLLLSALPVLALALLGRGPRGWEDWLPVLAAPVLFSGLYIAVNPTLLGEVVSVCYPMAAVTTALSLLAAWIVLKLLRGLDGAPEEKLARAFSALLTGCALLLAFQTTCGQAAALGERWSAAVAGSTSPVGFTLWMLALLAVLNVVPGLLAALTMVWGSELAAVLGAPSFQQEGVELCRRTAVFCRRVAVATVLLAVLANLLQLALLGQLRSTYFSVALPLLSLMLSAGLFLLCRCLQRGRALQEDSDSII